MREFLKAVLRAVHLDNYAKAGVIRLRLFKFTVLKVGRTIARDYLRAHQVRKLHIGCGDHLLEGWLNSDYNPHLPGVLHLDATKRFPFAENTFDFVFSEHMIEHIGFAEVLRMLSECYRVLRPNGHVRISTPDLRFLLELYGDAPADVQSEYIRWTSDNWIKWPPYPDAAFVINNYMRAWEHKFIYDRKTLGWAIAQAGFKRVQVCGLNESEFDALRNLENEGRMPAGFLKLETLTMEGVKE